MLSLKCLPDPTCSFVSASGGPPSTLILVLLVRKALERVLALGPSLLPPGLSSRLAQMTWSSGYCSCSVPQNLSLHLTHQLC